MRNKLHRKFTGRRLVEIAGEIERDFREAERLEWFQPACSFACAQIGGMTVVFAVDEKGSELQKFVEEQWNGYVQTPAPKDEAKP